MRRRKRLRQSPAVDELVHGSFLLSPTYENEAETSRRRKRKLSPPVSPKRKALPEDLLEELNELLPRLSSVQVNNNNNIFSIKAKKKRHRKQKTTSEDAFGSTYFDYAGWLRERENESKAFELQRVDGRVRQLLAYQHPHQTRCHGDQINYLHKAGKEFRSPLIPAREEALTFMRMHDIAAVLQHQGAPQKNAILSLQGFFRRCLRKKRKRRQEKMKTRLLSATLRMQFCFRYRRIVNALRKADAQFQKSLLKRWYWKTQRSRRHQLSELVDMEIDAGDFIDAGVLLRQELFALTRERIELPWQVSEMKRLTRFLEHFHRIKVTFSAWKARARLQGAVANPFRQSASVLFGVFHLWGAVIFHSMLLVPFRELHAHAQAAVVRRKRLSTVFLLCVDLDSHNSSRQRDMLIYSALPFWKRKTKQNAFAALRENVSIGVENRRKADAHYRLHVSAVHGIVNGRALICAVVPHLFRAFGALPHYFSSWYHFSNWEKRKRTSLSKAISVFQARSKQVGLAALKRHRNLAVFQRNAAVLAVKFQTDQNTSKYFHLWQSVIHHARNNVVQAVAFRKEKLLRACFHAWTAYIFFERHILESVYATVRDICENVIQRDSFRKAEALRTASLGRKCLRRLKTNVFVANLQAEQNAKADRARQTFLFQRWRQWHVPLHVRIDAALRVQCFWRTRKAKLLLKHMEFKELTRRALEAQQLEDAKELLDKFAVRIQRQCRAYLAILRDRRAQEIEQENLALRRKQNRHKSSVLFKSRFAAVKVLKDKENRIVRGLAAKRIQSCFRGWWNRYRNPIVLQIRIRLVAILAIQAVYRRHLRRRQKSATKVQAWFRGVYQRNQLGKHKVLQQAWSRELQQQRRAFEVLRPVFKKHRRVSQIVAVMQDVGVLETQAAAEKALRRIELLDQLQRKHERRLMKKRELLANGQLLPEIQRLPGFVRMQLEKRPKLKQFTEQTLLLRHRSSVSAAKFAKQAVRAVSHLHKSSLRSVHRDSTQEELVKISRITTALKQQLVRKAQDARKELLLEREEQARKQFEAAAAIQAAFRGKAIRVRYQRHQMKLFLDKQDPSLIAKLESRGIVGRRDQIRAIKLISKSSFPVASSAGARLSVVFPRRSKRLSTAGLAVEDFHPNSIERAKRKRGTTRIGLHALVSRPPKVSSTSQHSHPEPSPRTLAKFVLYDAMLANHLSALRRQRHGHRRNAVPGLEHTKRREGLVNLPKDKAGSSRSLVCQDYFEEGKFSFRGFWKDAKPFGFGTGVNFKERETSSRFFWRQFVGGIREATGTWRHGQMKGVFRITYTSGSEYVGLVQPDGVACRRGRFRFVFSATCSTPFDGLFGFDSRSVENVAPQRRVENRKSSGQPHSRNGSSGQAEEEQRFSSERKTMGWDLNQRFPVGVAFKTDFLSLSSGASDDVIQPCPLDDNGTAADAPEVLLECMYDGQLDDAGNFCGTGHLILPNGTSYNGRFKNNLPEGIGKVIYMNGDVFEGEFQAGLRNGRGKFTQFSLSQVDGTSWYEGTWEKDQIHGFGKSWNAALKKGFEGPFVNGVPQGRGKETLEGGCWRPAIFYNGEVLKYISPVISPEATAEFIQSFSSNQSENQDHEALSSPLAQETIRWYQERFYLESPLRAPLHVNGENPHVMDILHRLDAYWKAAEFIQYVETRRKTMANQVQDVAYDLEELEEIAVENLDAYEVCFRRNVSNGGLMHVLRQTMEVAKYKLMNSRFDFAERISECQVGVVGSLSEEASKLLLRLTSRHVDSLLYGYNKQPPLFVRRTVGILWAIVQASRNMWDSAAEALEWVELNQVVQREDWELATGELFLDVFGQSSTHFIVNEMSKINREWKQALELRFEVADGDDTMKNVRYDIGLAGNASAMYLLDTIELAMLEPRNNLERILTETGDMYRCEMLHALWSWIYAWYACCRANRELFSSFKHVQQWKAWLGSLRARFEQTGQEMESTRVELTKLRTKLVAVCERMGSTRQTLTDLVSVIRLGENALEDLRELLAGEKLARRVAQMQSFPEMLVVDWKPNEVADERQHRISMQGRIESLKQERKELEAKQVELSNLVVASRWIVQQYEEKSLEKLGNAERRLRALKPECLGALAKLGMNVAGEMFTIGRLLCSLLEEKDISWKHSLELFAEKTFDWSGRVVYKARMEFIDRLLNIDRKAIFGRHALLLRSFLEKSGLDVGYMSRKIQSSYDPLAAEAACAILEWVFGLDSFCRVEQLAQPIRTKLQEGLESLERTKDRLGEINKELEQTTTDLSWRRRLLHDFVE